MTDPGRTAESDSGAREGRWIPRTRLGKLGHLLFWTALFYGLAVGIARLCEWLSP